MPILQANAISYHFDNGDVLFNQLSCAMTATRVGLLGRNGAGKSLLAAILCGERAPSSGAVNPPQSVLVYRQNPADDNLGELSIAQFLGKDKALLALERINAGDCAEHWFEAVNEHWDLPGQLATELEKIGLPSDPATLCGELSGGQLARLRLWQLFASDAELLILDEPSNHLDKAAKQWLLAAMADFSGAILLISHDRELLRDMDEIWELSSLGLQAFGGNYDHYDQQKQREVLAVERQLNSVHKQQKQLQQQTQRNKEKAEQRAAQGKKLRNSGSQPKVLLDSKKDKATAGVSSRNKNAQRRADFLHCQVQQLSERKVHLGAQRLHIQSSDDRQRRVIALLDAQLPYGTAKPINLQIRSTDKLHLLGANGSGKSTLLKCLLGEYELTQGNMSVNTPLYYLDQHFGQICTRSTMLANLTAQCDGMAETDGRTLLAGIGFRRDSIYRLGGELSGGEKMKLAMLIASHQPQQPLLLLDEPDNHLDIESKILLAQALQSYRGGFVLISHDSDFAKEAGVNCQFELD